MALWLSGVFPLSGQIKASLGKKWSAYWINGNSAQGQYVVNMFRKQVNILKVPKILHVRISADNRYELYVNGERIAYGPARGENENYYDVVNIAPYLQPGTNQVALLNWNYGTGRHVAQMTVGTGVVMFVEDSTYQDLNTNNTWKYMQNKAFSPYRRPFFHGVTGVEDKIEGELYPWG